MGICESTTEKRHQHKGNQGHGQSSGYKTDNRIVQNVKSNKYPRGEVYYLKKKEMESFQGEVIGGKSRVELYLSIDRMIQGLGSISVDVQMSSYSNEKQFSSLGDTGPMPDNGKLAWLTTFSMDYFFERHQYLKFIIKVNGQPSYTIEATLGKIIGSRNNICNFPVNINFNEFNLVVSAKPVSKESKNTFINFVVNDDFTRTILPTNYFVIISNFNDGSTWRPIYKSIEVPPMSSLKFPPLINSDICNGDFNKKILFEFYSDTTQGLMGTVLASLADIREGQKFSIGTPMNTPLSTCSITFTENRRKTFIELIQEGLQISLMIGIDFTASNRKPNEPSSLHYIYGQEPNQYESVIRACGSIVSYYDYDQQFPVLGFGAILPNQTESNNCFNCSLSPDPNVKGIDEVIKAYYNSLSVVQLYGPTYFGPIIQNVVSMVRNSQGRNYYILMILTDGEIHDMGATKDIIWEAALLPISIIIVGIGNNEDFKQMVELDGDTYPIYNSRGQRIVRDIVQFVPFSKYASNAQKLSEEVLKEIPNQVESYFAMNQMH